MLALYEFVGERDNVGLGASEESKVFGSLVGVTFSLWRAAFLADMPTRTWEQALEDAQELLTLQSSLMQPLAEKTAAYNRHGLRIGRYLAYRVVSFQELTTPTNGFAISASVRPIARRYDRAGARE